MRSTKFSVIKKAVVGKDSRIHDQVNLYGCKIGKNTKIDSYVYIEEGVTIGDNCKIRAWISRPSLSSPRQSRRPDHRRDRGVEEKKQGPSLDHQKSREKGHRLRYQGRIRICSLKRLHPNRR